MLLYISITRSLFYLYFHNTGTVEKWTCFLRMYSSETPDLQHDLYKNSVQAVCSILVFKRTYTRSPVSYTSLGWQLINTVLGRFCLVIGNTRQALSDVLGPKRLLNGHSVHYIGCKKALCDNFKIINRLSELRCQIIERLWRRYYEGSWFLTSAERKMYNLIMWTL